jgi:predicted transposase YbfD/YdcC
VERRTLTSSVALNDYLNWPGVGQVCQLVRERTIHGVKQTETIQCVTSLSRQKADAERLLNIARRHWGAIENGVHYMRDEMFAEDRCTIAAGDAPQNLAALRNAALNWLRDQGTTKFTQSLRSYARNSLRLFAKLGFVK